jgi:hypothetical protein
MFGQAWQVWYKKLLIFHQNSNNKKSNLNQKKLFWSPSTYYTYAGLFPTVSSKAHHRNTAQISGHDWIKRLFTLSAATSRN